VIHSVDNHEHSDSCFLVSTYTGAGTLFYLQFITPLRRLLVSDIKADVT
jgi:hypothetical protein